MVHIKAITLSYTINQDKQKYYKTLEELYNPHNKGEGTFLYAKFA